MPDGYLEALQRLALALADYRARTGDDAVLVGAAAVTLHKAGWFPSGDSDLVAASTAVFDAVMAGQGFRPAVRWAGRSAAVGPHGGQLAGSRCRRSRT